MNTLLKVVIFSIIWALITILYQGPMDTNYPLIVDVGFAFLPARAIMILLDYWNGHKIQHGINMKTKTFEVLLSFNSIPAGSLISWDDKLKKYVALTGQDRHIVPKAAMLLNIDRLKEV